MYNTGKDLIEFIQDNKLEGISWGFNYKSETIFWKVILNDRDFLEYVIYLDSDSDVSSIAIWYDKSGDEIVITAEEALKLRGLG